MARLRAPWLPRLCAPLAACLGLVLAVPLAGLAQGTAPYQYAPGFPVPNSGAPDYPYIDITGVCVGHNGNIYITQGRPSKNHVLVFSPSGDYLFTFGTDVLEEPHTIRCDPEGNLWVTDFYTNLVTKWNEDGQLLATYGVRGHGSPTPGRFAGPNDVAFAPNGDIFVAEGDGARVVRLAHDGSYILSWRRPGKKPGFFRFPHSIAVDARGLVYVAERKNKAIEVFTPDGQFQYQWQSPAIGTPWSLWITPDQRLFVADGNKGRILIMDLQGNVLSSFGRGGRQPGHLAEAHMICVDNSGVLYEADASGKRVQKFVPQ